MGGLGWLPILLLYVADFYTTIGLAKDLKGKWLFGEYYFIICRAYRQLDSFAQIGIRNNNE